MVRGFGGKRLTMFMSKTLPRVPYNCYRYLYPVRAHQAHSPQDLPKYDDGTYFAQVKFNGSNTLIFTNGEDLRIMNRHREERNIKAYTELQTSAINLHRGSGWMVLNGEYMDKSKKDAGGNVFKGFIIYDLLAFSGEILTGTSFLKRYAMLQNAFSDVLPNDTTSDHPHAPFTKLISPNLNNCYLANNYHTDFMQLYKEFVAVDMYEGFVLKRKDAILLPPYTEHINDKSSIKFRKPTLNYQF